MEIASEMRILVGMVSRITNFLGASVLTFATAVSVSGPATAQEYKSLTVVELYTSMACSTCPPADAVLAALAERDDLLTLSFHVDYWDYVGWADPFGDAKFTLRQERYLERFGINYMLTPQIFVDGMLEGVGSDLDAIQMLIADAKRTRMNEVAISITRTGAREVQVTLPSMEYGGYAEVILVRYDARHQTKVSGGDNDGKLLTNVNVVRQIVVHSLWKGEPIVFDAPLEMLGDDDLQFYAVIVQEPNQGPILGASYIDLRDGA